MMQHISTISRLFGLFCVGLGTMFQPALADPSQHCAPRDDVVEKLNLAYGETRRSLGLGDDNSLMEIFASHDTGTWTITVTSAQGITCLVATGQAFDGSALPMPMPMPQKGA